MNYHRLYGNFFSSQNTNQNLEYAYRPVPVQANQNQSYHGESGRPISNQARPSFIPRKTNLIMSKVVAQASINSVPFSLPKPTKINLTLDKVVAQVSPRMLGLSVHRLQVLKKHKAQNLVIKLIETMPPKRN